MHLLQLAGPTNRGHASSIQARMSAGSPSVLGSPAFTALGSRSTHLLQLAGPTNRGHASLIQALSLAVSASTVSFLEYSVLSLWGWIPSPTLLLPASCASEGTSHKRPARARHRALYRHLLAAYGALQDRLGAASASLLDAVEEVLHQRHRALASPPVIVSCARGAGDGTRGPALTSA